MKKVGFVFSNIYKMSERQELFMKEKILRVLDEQIDGFICPNQTDFNDIDIHKLFRAIDSLIEDGILRRRNCAGLAYEMVPSLEAKLKVAEILGPRINGDSRLTNKEIER